MLGVSRTAEVPRLASSWRATIDDYPTALAASRDAGMLVVGTSGGLLVGIDAASGAVSWRQECGGVLAVSFGPESIAVGGQDGRTRIYAPTGALLRELPATGPWVEQVAWSPNGEYLATASGKVVRLWHADGRPFLETHAHASTVTALQWNRRGTELAVACYGGVYLWELDPGANPRRLPFKGSLISLAWSPDDRFVACGSQDCSVHFWRLPTGRGSEMSGYPQKPKALAWDANTTMLATGGAPSVCLWDFSGKGPEGSMPKELAAHGAAIVGLAFHPRKALLASSALDRMLCVWEPRKGLQPIGRANLSDRPECLWWHPKEASVVTADASGEIASWRVESARTS